MNTLPIQLTLAEYFLRIEAMIEAERITKEPYLNLLGQVLPWEEDLLNESM